MEIFPHYGWSNKDAFLSLLTASVTLGFYCQKLCLQELPWRSSLFKNIRLHSKRHGKSTDTVNIFTNTFIAKYMSQSTEYSSVCTFSTICLILLKLSHL